MSSKATLIFALTAILSSLPRPEENGIPSPVRQLWAVNDSATVDSVFLRQRHSATERFLHRTAFVPNKQDFPGLYVSPYVYHDAFILQSDTTVISVWQGTIQDTFDLGKYRLSGNTLACVSQSAPTQLASPLEDLLRRTSSFPRTYEFHRIDSTVFLVHSSVLNDFAEYYFAGSKANPLNEQLFDLVFIRQPDTALTNLLAGLAQQSNKPTLDMNSSTFAFLFFFALLGAIAYALILMRRIVQAIESIADKLTDRQADDEEAPT